MRVDHAMSFGFLKNKFTCFGSHLFMRPQALSRHWVLPTLLKSVSQVTSTCYQCSINVVARTLLPPHPTPSYVYIYIHINMLLQHVIKVASRCIKSVFQVTSTCYHCSIKSVFQVTSTCYDVVSTSSKSLKHVINIASRASSKLLQHVVNVASRASSKLLLPT